MEKVEGRVEELIAGAHGEQDGAGGVVEVHDGVPAGVHELVARSALKFRNVSELSKLPSRESRRVRTCMREVCRWIQWQLMSMTMLSWKKNVHDG